ncbi:hypothetical protein CSC81_10335 [Tenacibaculum discolor]|uniref:Uncharacterized protein n=1 Tax=Tenacibaculum discolor TaxID=361581 RepID=A0A2G1BTT0_9FLAO|nr:hypothetical protein [Tenacibaculum discolor]PHN97461.1 hypothetical protein CSC81_10335 [Tenacibaculum discolor]
MQVQTKAWDTIKFNYFYMLPTYAKTNTSSKVKLLTSYCYLLIINLKKHPYKQPQKPSKPDI